MIEATSLDFCARRAPKAACLPYPACNTTYKAVTPAGRHQSCKRLPSDHTATAPETSTMKAILIPLMLCIGICTSAPGRRLNKRGTCDPTGSDGFRGFGGMFPATGVNDCVWDFFGCTSTEDSLDYSELDVRGDTLSESCCKKRFKVCSMSFMNTKQPSDNDVQDSEDYSGLDTRGDSLSG